ncbi:MAG: hypothetical protein ACU0A2_06005 [Cognatishimia sp.]
MADFDGWLAAQKTRLEAAGLTILDVTGTAFSGYYFPDTVNRTIFGQ